MKKLTTLLIAMLVAATIFAQQDQEDQDETRKRRKLGTRHSISFDVGLNNILEDGKSPQENNELYAVKPFGSWNFSINSVHDTHITGALHLQWGGGISWYNFKFEDATARINKLDDGIEFIADSRPDINPIKSKLTSTYLNVNLVPMLDFSSNRRRDSWSWRRRGRHSDFRFHSGSNGGFRIGVGGYAGYKIDSYSKAVYTIEGDKKRDKNKDSLFLNTWRYGARLQVGYRDVDIFVNYDVSELFAENKGPQVNAFSFGITI